VLIGPDGRARLTDFGIARHEDASTLTQAGQVVGTLAYMAPEIQRGDPATPRSDLYSLGVLLRACGGDREPSLVPLIERLSARDPAGRPASAAQALTILANTGATPAEPDTDATQPLAATEPTAVLTSGPPRQARARVGRDRRLSARSLVATVAVLSAVAIALTVSLASRGSGDRSPPATTQPGQTTQPPSATGGQAAEGGSPKPSTQPEPDAPGVDCSAIERQKKMLERDKKAAEQAAGDDKQAKERIKEQFEAEKKTLEEHAKTCE
jgi:serine/threonine protein kinase